MQTFDSVWSSSANNIWAYAFPSLLVVGMLVVASLSLMQNTTAKKVTMILVSLGFAYACTEASFQSINEKWRIRHEWTEKNYDSLTERQKEISITDGANLIMAPPINGLFALLCFVGTIIFMSFIQRIRNPKQDGSASTPAELIS